eukprot:312334_1
MKFMTSLIVLIWLFIYECNGNFCPAKMTEKNANNHCYHLDPSTPECDKSGTAIDDGDGGEEFACICVSKPDSCDKWKNKKDFKIRGWACKKKNCKVTKCAKGFTPTKARDGCQKTTETAFARGEYKNDYLLYEDALNNAELASANIQLAQELIQRDQQQMKRQKRHSQSRLYQYSDW